MTLETVSSNALPDKLHLLSIRDQFKAGLVFYPNWDVIPTSVTLVISSFRLGLFTLEFIPLHRPTSRFMPTESFEFSYLVLPPSNILEIIIKDRFPEYFI